MYFLFNVALLQKILHVFFYDFDQIRIRFTFPAYDANSKLQNVILIVF